MAHAARLIGSECGKAELADERYRLVNTSASACVTVRCEAGSTTGAEQMWTERGARTDALGFGIITHDIRDCLDSEWGRAIMTNSSSTLLRKEDSCTIDAVMQAYNLSAGEKRFLLGCAKGEGRSFAKGSRGPMKVVASPLEHRLTTTGRQEVMTLMRG